MKIYPVLVIVSVLLLLLSVGPAFNILRENYIGLKISNRYDIQYAFPEVEGNHPAIPELTIEQINIKIKEEKTGRWAPKTPWDIEENVEAGEIIKLHIFVNDKEITSPNEIWLSNRDGQPKYFAWFDVLTVEDRRSGNKLVKIVQRLSHDDDHSEDKWKIITINEDGKVKEDRFTYSERSKHLLDVRVINFSGTGRNSIGYYSDILHTYPSLFFPLLYPICSFLIGLILLCIVTYKRFQNYS